MPELMSIKYIKKSMERDSVSAIHRSQRGKVLMRVMAADVSRADNQP
ncbi:hypothetical protein [Trinickia soli]|nr:hypothetical protein [Trinickia soli]